ncbi:PREDICTED: synaptotagmin-5-like [Calidris pugnax]|uniref:synaptotagmin-5-like n=1 Tax=Calidris pugnax TaxID=198806 RepID=UPI00071D1A73|nr:PREDICTED: synaptotagmin-5-like [Calidris pugnax]
MIQKRSVMLDLHSLQMPFSNTWKYGILALAILLLLVALTILTCQICQLQKRNRTRKKKRCPSRGWVRMKAVNGIWRKKTPALLHDTTKQSNADIKVEELQAELGEPSTCLISSSSRTEDLSSMSSDLGPLPGSQGTLKFSLLYCKERCELLLTGLEAWGLPRHGCAESAIRVRLLRQVPSHIPGLQCVVQEWQSQVVKNCSSPAFGDHFVFSLQDAEVEKSTLKLEVQRFDKYSRNAVLGEVRVTLSELKASQSLVLCKELQKTTKDIVGEVLVSLKCLPISQRIEVGLLKAKTTSPGSTAEKNVYARIDVSWRRHKEKHQKSRPRAHTPLIIFNETFLFHMPEPLAWDCTVLVSIYEVDSDSRHLVGQATLGKRRAKEAAEHWDLMVKSIQQPVAKWHPLLI